MSPTNRLKKARIALLMDEPFFGSLMMQLKPVEDRKVPTFRTNGDKLWYNPDYMETLDDRQLRTVLAHEVLHPALLHPYRIGNRDLHQANVAADYAINNFLDDYNRAAVAKGQLAPFPWPMKDGKPNVMLDHQYDGLSFEEIYARLKDQQGGNGGEQNQPSAGQNDGSSKDSAASSPGEFEAGPADDAKAQAEEARWKVAVKQAATMAKAQGRLPGGMDRIVDELLDPRATWKEILRNLLTSIAKDDYTWARPNTRYASGGCILPSLHSPRLGRIAVAIDTSGSIGHRQLTEFMSEVNAILFDCRPEKMVIIQCDAKIHEWTEIDPFDEVNFTLKGGGGTDFRPVFERLADEAEPPAALVYLTDLYGRFPAESPAYPVIWACNNDQQAPFGETLNI